VLRLYQPDDNFSIYDTVMSSRAGTSGKYTEVEAHTLDSILGASGLQAIAADWVKIDVEGAELEVLKGATGMLAANHDTTILMEIHDVQDNGHYAKIAGFLEAFGFGIEFEKSYGAERERHVIFRKQALVRPALGNPSVQGQKSAQEVL
jgi:phosphoribosylformylglycinamidine (FGAM) synthase-like enzyme